MSSWVGAEDRVRMIRETALRRACSDQYLRDEDGHGEGSVDLRRLSDEQLLARAGRDRAAFEEFYRRTVARVVAFAARRCRRPQEVPDLVAAIWLEVIASADRFDPGRGKAVPWVLGVAAKVTASDARRRARERLAAARLAGRRLLDEDDHARLERAIDAAAIAPGVRAAIESLPEGERLVVELVALEGLSPAGAGQALGLRPAAARMRLARARRKLREALGDRPDGLVSLARVEEVIP
jgi:RNA polymerase sigma factor (sigma-70 family)